MLVGTDGESGIGANQYDSEDRGQGGREGIRKGMGGTELESVWIWREKAEMR
jgi:hypothetical protein